MAHQHEKISWVSPYLIVRDIEKAVAFYQSAFGFTVKDIAKGEEGFPVHAEMYYKDQLIMCGKEGAFGGTSKAPISNGVECPISLYVYTENVDHFFKHATENDALGLIPPEDMFWGDRMCQLKDIDGYIWCVASKKGCC